MNHCFRATFASRVQGAVQSVHSQAKRALVEHCQTGCFIFGYKEHRISEAKLCPSISDALALQDSFIRLEQLDGARHVQSARISLSLHG